MPLHDRYARITPGEISFPDRETAEERFRAIAGEAEARGVDAADPSAFVMLLETGRALRELRGPGEDPERVREHGVLLYHLFNAWRAGDSLYLLDTRVVRLLLESSPWEPAGPAPPLAAAYVQLPQHLVWVRPAGEEPPGSAVEGAVKTRPPTGAEPSGTADAIAPPAEGGDGPPEGGDGSPEGGGDIPPPEGGDGPPEGTAPGPGASRRAGGGTPESLDGFFWTVWERSVSFLLVLGIRPDRPGFGVVPLDPVPLDRVGEWVGATVRPEGGDFTSTMPGAELERLYEMRTAGEALKLGVRAFRYLATVPDEAVTAVDPGDRPPPASGPAPDGPRPSTRPYARVTLIP